MSAVLKGRRLHRPCIIVAPLLWVQGFATMQAVSGSADCMKCIVTVFVLACKILCGGCTGEVQLPPARAVTSRMNHSGACKA
jgi:hypothetical protein